MIINDFDTFELDESLLNAIKDKGYLRPTAIQSATIIPAMEGRNVMGSAPTGTGKTAAFLLPVLQHLLDFPRRKPGAPRVLILTPTRELAMQVAEQAKQLAKYTSLKVATITGGVAYMNHAEIFSTNQDIVVATPGRLLQYIREENFDCRAIEVLILDEADRMLDMGFAQDIELVAAETHWRKQTLLFSATLEGKLLADFARRLLEDPVLIEAESSRRERKKIPQFYYRADDLSHKTKILCHLLKQPEMSKVIVFVRKRERVHELVTWLLAEGIKSCYLEGEMVQAKRNEAIRRLENNHVKVLVATDVAARGLDLDSVSHVINFDLPRTADIYLHRIGRTARAGKKGIALSLVEAHDYLFLDKISRYIQEPIKSRVIAELKPTTKTPSAKSTKPSKKVLAKRKEQKENANQNKKKIKVRQRDQKNVGKRRKSVTTATNNQQNES